MPVFATGNTGNVEIRNLGARDSERQAMTPPPVIGRAVDGEGRRGWRDGAPGKLILGVLRVLGGQDQPQGGGGGGGG